MSSSNTAEVCYRSSSYMEK